MDTFSKVTEYKINSQTSVTLLYTNEKLSEKEIRETTPIMKASNNMNHLTVTQINGVKDLCDKILKTRNK